jgi:hypothetical protein
MSKKTAANILALRRSLAALRAHYTRAASAFDALPRRGYDLRKSELIGTMADLSDRIEKIESKRGVL